MLSVRSRILCIEDDPDICDLLSLYLGEEFEIETSSSLKDARRILELTRIDLLVLDEEYSDGGGLDFIRGIRASGSEIPIIYQSAHGFPEDIQQGLDAGANVYLVKPVDMEELLAKIKQIINSKDHSRAAH